MTQIKFGTDGWRAILDEEYTPENVARVAKATADWVKQKYENPAVVLGHDCRRDGPLFAEVTAKVLCSEGIKVYLAEGFVSTPMVCLGILDKKAQLGVVITASHNPPSYNGYKLKADFGGPLAAEHITELEALIPGQADIPKTSLDEYREKGLLEGIELEDMYMAHVEKNFDMEAISDSPVKIGYDAMFGAGQNVIRRLFPDAVLLHADYDTSFQGMAPEPIARNLEELSELVKNSDIDLGLATDGDADRIGLLNSEGKFIDANHIIMLLMHYFHKYKKMSGKVVVSFSCSLKIKKLCEAYGIPYEVTKIGFKYIAGRMITEKVLVGGEESGGVAMDGHIPERDGIWVGLVLLECMAKTGKSLEELIKEVDEVVGAFSYNRNDLHINEDQKLAVIQKLEAGVFESFGDYAIKRSESIDGYKFYFENDAAVMIRPSGTEPVLRVYAEAEDEGAVNKILESTTTAILEN